MHPGKPSANWNLRRPRQHATRAPQAGFTLVELLIVITIIVTLTAIGFSVFLKTTAKANNVRAIENMRQIGVAIASYTSDYDHLPGFQDAGVSPVLSTATPYSQASILQPYLGYGEATAAPKYPPIFRPPGLKPNNMAGKNNWYELICYAMYSTDYLTKAYLPNSDDGSGPFGKATGGDPGAGWKMAQLDSALAQYSALNGGKIVTLSMVPAMLEINGTGGSWPWSVPPKPVGGTHVNVLYFDWHVAPVAPTYFYTN